jgi:anti-anti-sigma regulatory factor
MSARELAAQAAKAGERRQLEPAGSDITVTGTSVGSRATATAAFEVAQANPGLCSVLENAALCYANGQAAAARLVLEQGIASEPDTKISALAWLALFDLMQREGDRAAFDRLAMDYVVQFERSAPGWEGAAKLKVAPRSVGGHIALTGRLGAASAAQLEALKRAVARGAHATRLDLMAVFGFDDAGARLLAGALAEARRSRVGLQVQTGTKLVPALDAALKKGREAGEGAWLLSLELLQWANDRAAFEDRAIEFAVTFEVSPPSWEPLAPIVLPTKAAERNGERRDDAADAETLKWSGVMTGSLSPQLGKLADFAHGRTVVAVDLSEVERIDFVCAGAMLNLIARLEAERKAVQIVGASPILRALLLLIGVSPRHFVKKSQ